MNGTQELSKMGKGNKVRKKRHNENEIPGRKMDEQMRERNKITRR
jgi:hypothetical protein